MEDGISSAIKVIIFLILFVGGIASDIAKKNKAKKRAEDMERAEAPHSKSPNAGTPTRSAAPRTRQAQPPKKAAAPKPAKPSAARNDDSEWLSSVADRERREAVKAAAKLTALESGSPFNAATDGQLESPPPPFYQQSTSPIHLSARQARDGFVLSEILGPPVSMRR